VPPSRFVGWHTVVGGDEAERAVIWLWCARLAWAALPVTTGTALSNALDGWSDAPAYTAAALLWLAWAAGMLALFAPRPVGLTALRIAAPAAIATVVVAAFAAPAGAGVLAIATTLAAAGFALSSPVARATGNALAYGDEQRFPLRVPMPLLLGPLPLAAAGIAAGVATGPLLVADERYALGAMGVVFGWPLAYALSRAVHALSQRWLVLVPAGIALVDSMTLIDPILVRREQIARMQRVNTTTVPDGMLDLRLGTLNGSVAIALSEPVPFGRRRGRTATERVEPRVVLVAVGAAAEVVARAAARRITTT
jgi:hypothetical protein